MEGFNYENTDGCYNGYYNYLSVLLMQRKRIRQLGHGTNSAAPSPDVQTPYGTSDQNLTQSGKEVASGSDERCRTLSSGANLAKGSDGIDAGEDNSEDDLQKTLLSVDELSYYINELNRDSEFFMCEYSKPSEIDLNMVLLYGADKYGVHIHTATPDELEDYLQAAGKDSADNLVKIDASDLNKLLTGKLNITVSDVSTEFNWVYLDKYDAYYSEFTDPEETNRFYCASGYKTDGDDYVITCIFNDLFYSCTVTFHKSGTSSYTFISNSISKEKTPLEFPEVNGRTELNGAELAWFTDYFQHNDNNGFLLSNYNSPSEIDLNQLFYCGAGMDACQCSEGEKKILGNEFGFNLDLDIAKLTTAQINSYLKEKAGITLSDVSTDFHWTYIEKYDAYYFNAGDTNYTYIYCYEGYKTGDGKYVIYYTDDYIGTPSERCTVTLQKSGENYMFVSNEIQTPKVITEYVVDRAYGSIDYTDSFSYHLPAVNINSQYADEINSDIRYNFLGSINDELKDLSDGYEIFIEKISYRTYVNDDMISLLIETNCDCDIDDYLPYNFNSDDGKRITNSELLKLKGISQQDFLDTVHVLMEKKYKSGFSEAPVDDFYNEQLEKTLSSDNINMNIPMFLDDDGTINIVATIYSLAGGDCYDHIIDTGL